MTGEISLKEIRAQKEAASMIPNNNVFKPWAHKVMVLCDEVEHLHEECEGLRKLARLNPYRKLLAEVLPYIGGALEKKIEEALKE